MICFPWRSPLTKKMTIEDTGLRALTIKRIYWLLEHATESRQEDMTVAKEVCFDAITDPFVSITDVVDQLVEWADDNYAWVGQNEAGRRRERAKFTSHVRGMLKDISDAAILLSRHQISLSR